MAEAGDIYVGCCGWPEGKARYFSHFRAVELQDTFYEPPAAELAAKWQRAAPAGFQFCLKAWQLITHNPTSPTYRKLKSSINSRKPDAYGFFRPTKEVWAAWERTAGVARAVHATAIVFQCPASFQPAPQNIANLKIFFQSVDREGRLFVWEPRGNWPPELIRETCEELDLIHCVDPFQALPTWGKALYFRLHGRGGYRYRYSDEELRQLLDIVGRLRWESRSAYVMFNNSYMKDDAQRFQSFLAGMIKH